LSSNVAILFASENNEVMDAIHFQAEVSKDGTIRIPDGVSVPAGPAQITVCPSPPELRRPTAGNLLPDRQDFGSVWEWLAAVGKQAEQWDTNLPSDLAENHDFYAHGKPRE
jgi:hypothetical protein